MTEVYLFTEAAADARTAALLIDRLCPGSAHHYRGVTEDTRFTRRGSPPADMSFTPFRHIGSLTGARVRARRGEGYATQAMRRAINAATANGRHRPPIVIVKDDDHQHGLAEAIPLLVADYPSLPLILGACLPEMEIWRLHAFDPRDPADAARLADQRRALGADPRELDPATVKSGAEFDHRGQPVKRNAKRILRALTADDPHRADDDLATADLDLLRARGQGSGLAGFLDAIDIRLRPALCP